MNKEDKIAYIKEITAITAKSLCRDNDVSSSNFFAKKVSDNKLDKMIHNLDAQIECARKTRNTKMKKEIMKLVENEGKEELAINKYCTLYSERESNAKLKCDNYDRITFTASINHVDSFNTKIVARDYEGIMLEVQACIDKAFEKAKEIYIKEFKNGHFTN